ncbi:MAG TPA: M56 family metallopeptidase [Vicinamibacterales bacterium]|nr:M56 family metallopeptidase [Vicinamibacterales bacterium]
MTAALVNHLWQSTLAAALAWVAALVLSRARAKSRHAVWLAASLKFLLPIGPLLTFATAARWRPVLAVSSVPFALAADPRIQFLAPAPIRAAVHQPLDAAAGRFAGAMPMALLSLWIAGAVVMLATWIVRRRRVSRLIRASAVAHSGSIVDTLRTLERRFGVRRPIRLAMSPAGALEPGVWGVVNPTLVWPERIGDHLTPEQVEAIVAHEVMHVKRADNLAAMLHMAVQTLFWFHPMVWWIGTRLVDERERACDEAVLAAGSRPEAYAESILTTCRLYLASPIASFSGVTGADLRKRIERIMTNDAVRSLSLWRRCLLATVGVAAIVIPAIVGVRVQSVLAQQFTTPPTAAFDVTSVKPNNSGSGLISMMPAANGGFQAINVTLGFMIRTSYRVQDNQIVGGPSWIFADRFDVLGTGTAPGKDGMPLEKFKSLLADRFHLAMHVEQRELPIYALVTATRDGKPGEHLKPAAVDCAAEAAAARGRGPAAPPAPGQTPRCGVGLGPGSFTMGGQPMSTVAMQLSRVVGRIVVDKTNLPGGYDLTLTYQPDPGLVGRGDLPPLLNGAAPSFPDRPSIFVALQEQLGLKLESTKGPVDVLVIDRAEKPTSD